MEKLEEVGLSFLSDVKDIVTNIDLDDAQYNILKLYEAGRALGLDAGDLADYGFEVKSSKCGGKSCIPIDKIKSFDDFSSMAGKFSTKYYESSMKTYNKAKCHPSYQKNLAPTVEYFWTLFPLNIYFGPCGIFCELATFPCCWCI